MTLEYCSSKILIKVTNTKTESRVVYKTSLSHKEKQSGLTNNLLPIISELHLEDVCNISVYSNKENYLL